MMKKKQVKSAYSRLSIAAWNTGDIEPHRFFDVGPAELDKISSEYQHIEVTSWGVYARGEPRCISEDSDRIKAILESR